MAKQGDHTVKEKPDKLKQVNSSLAMVLHNEEVQQIAEVLKKIISTEAESGESQGRM